MNATIYLSYVMIAVLVLIALACLFVPAANDWLPGNRKYAMCAVLVLYSGVRFYRLQRFKKTNSI